MASSLQAAIESLQANRAAMFEVMGRSRRSTDLQLKAGAVSLAKVQLSIDHLSRAVQQLEAFDGVAR